MRLIRPGQSKIAHVARVDLTQCAVSLPIVVAIVSGPAIRRRFQQSLAVEPLGVKLTNCENGEKRAGHRGQKKSFGSHRVTLSYFRVWRYANTSWISVSVY